MGNKGRKERRTAKVKPSDSTWSTGMFFLFSKVLAPFGNQKRNLLVGSTDT